MEVQQNIIKQLAQNVYTNLGKGHTEYIYHRAFEIELRQNNIAYDSEKRVIISYNNHAIGDERIDIFLFENNVIIELKAIVTEPKMSEIIQVKKYYRELKKQNIICSYGIIINFPQVGCRQSLQSLDLVSRSIGTKDNKDDIDFIVIKFDNI